MRSITASTTPPSPQSTRRWRSFSFARFACLARRRPRSNWPCFSAIGASACCWHTASSAAGQDPRRVVLYAWNPLPLIEVAGNGHIDALGVLLLFAALYALHSQRWAAAICALAGAFLVKLVPLVLLPTFSAPSSRRLVSTSASGVRAASVSNTGAIGFLALCRRRGKTRNGFADLRATLAFQRGGLLALSLCPTAVGRPRLRTRSLALHRSFRTRGPRRPNPLPRPLPSRLRNPRCLRFALADRASLVLALGPPIPRFLFLAPLGCSSAA